MKGYKSPIRTTEPNNEKMAKRYREELKDWKAGIAKIYHIFDEMLGPIPKAIIRNELISGFGCRSVMGPASMKILKSSKDA